MQLGWYRKEQVEANGDEDNNNEIDIQNVAFGFGLMQRVEVLHTSQTLEFALRLERQLVQLVRLNAADEVHESGQDSPPPARRPSELVVLVVESAALD